MSLITICIVDNNPTHAEKIITGLQLLKTCEVIGTFGTAWEFLLFCNSSKQLPQIVFTEVDLPVVDGVLLTDYLHLYYPAIQVIAVSNHCHQEAVHDMFGCGAVGYVYKLFANTVNLQAIGQRIALQHPYSSLQKGIEAAHLNYKYIDPMLSLISQQDYSLTSVDRLLAKRMQQHKFFAQLGLSAHETQITILYAGTTLTKEVIGSILLFSVKKIEKDIGAIYKKLAVTDRHALGKMCLNKGFIKNARYIV